MLKVVLKAVFVTCVCLLLTKEASSLSSTFVGDILIQTLNNGSISCDSVICPEKTVKCLVTKRNDPSNFDSLIRHRKCLAQNDDVLLEEKINEPNKLHGTVNIVASSGSVISTNSLRELTTEERKEFYEHLERTNHNIQSNINGALGRVYTSLGPLMDGRFAYELQRQMANDFWNAFYF